MADHSRPMSFYPLRPAEAADQAAADGENTHCRNRFHRLGDRHGRVCGRPVSVVGADRCDVCGGPTAKDTKLREDLALADAAVERWCSGPREEAGTSPAADPLIDKLPGGLHSDPSPPIPQDAAPHGVLGDPLNRIHPAKACHRSDHREQLEAAGVAFTTHCLICAVWHATNDSRVVDWEREMLAWALEVAAVSAKDAEELALTAIESPYIFRGRFHLALIEAREQYLERAVGQIKAQHDKFERARQELRGSYSALVEMQQAHPFEAEIRDEIGVIEQQIASGLALLEEIGR